MDVKLIKASENVLLDIGHRAVVAAEDAAGRDAEQDADKGQESYLQLKWGTGFLKIYKIFNA